MLMGEAVETATEAVSNPLWATFLVGLVGAVIGASASYVIERLRQTETRRRRWDDEIIETAVLLIDECDKLVTSFSEAHVSITARDFTSDQGERRRLVKEAEAVLAVSLSRFTLICSPKLSKSAVRVTKAAFAVAKSDDPQTTGHYEEMMTEFQHLVRKEIDAN